MCSEDMRTLHRKTGRERVGKYRIAVGIGIDSTAGIAGKGSMESTRTHNYIHIETSVLHH